MKSRVSRNGDTFVIELEGKLDYETQLPLRENLSQLFKDAAGKDIVPRKIIFNLERLDFIGSSGISSFIQTLKQLNTQLPTRPRYCHVKSEFQKIIKAFDEDETFEFFENEDRAKRSFDH